LFNNIGAPELIVIALVLLLLFGGKKLPELAKGVGDAIREFKKAAKE
jgi:sec-independent protein translocase protein TatA